MLQIVLLLNPVYTTFFWFIVLALSNRIDNRPKQFLSVFMFASFILYLSHLFYFTNDIGIYYYLDPLYQLAHLFVYPLYHIYFRLLMVEEKVTFKKDGLFFILPVLLVVLYLSGYLFLPASITKAWLVNKTILGDLPAIQYMNTIEKLIRLVFILQVVFVLVANFRLIQKYRDKALEFYSDLEESRISSISILNSTLVITSFSSIILGAIGRAYFKNELIPLTIASFIFSCMLFLIGWLGFHQKVLNPIPDTLNQDVDKDIPVFKQQYLHDAILTLFNKDQLFLNSQLTIQEVAQSVGTNRTYVSIVINQRYNQNFCQFVNAFRIEAMEQQLIKNPDYTNHQLAENGGFGSVDTMKRAVKLKTGKTVTEWKKQVLMQASGMI